MDSIPHIIIIGASVARPPLGVERQLYGVVGILDTRDILREGMAALLQ